MLNRRSWRKSEGAERRERPGAYLIYERFFDVCSHCDMKRTGMRLAGAGRAAPAGKRGLVAPGAIPTSVPTSGAPVSASGGGGRQGWTRLRPRELHLRLEAAHLLGYTRRDVDRPSHAPPPAARLTGALLLAVLSACYR